MCFILHLSHAYLYINVYNIYINEKQENKFKKEIEMKTQIMLGNAEWMDINEEKFNSFIEEAASFHNTSMEEIKNLLSSGKEVKFGTDWYEMIRIAPQPESKEKKEARLNAIDAIFSQAEKQERWDNEDY